MVNEAIVNDTVRRMLDSGIDIPTIISTLKDIGLSEDEATAIVQKLNASVSSPKDSNLEQPNQEVRQMKEELFAQNEARENSENVVNSKFVEHEEKIDNVEKKINEVHDVVKKMPLDGKDPEMPRRFIEIHSRLDEIMADTKATKELMTKILEVNRKMLTELESKK